MANEQVSENRIAAVAEKLAKEDVRTSDRLIPALNAALAVVNTRTKYAGNAAAADFLTALEAAGADCLDGGDPQAVEDALLAAMPNTPLAEETFRLAWLALVDNLASSGDKPPFGGAEGAETWAQIARSRVSPYVDLAGQVKQTVELFGNGLQVVVVRGPGKSAFLAAVRRALLAANKDALIPPVIPAACDRVAGMLLPYIRRGELEQELRDALDKLGYGEDLVALLGRCGDKTPVALLLDDAHLESRSILLGLSLFMEPSAERKALLVLGAPDDTADDGPLSELLADAHDRQGLTEIRLPAFGDAFSSALLLERFGEVPRGLAEALTKASKGANDVESLKMAHAWLNDLAVSGESQEIKADAISILEKGIDLEEVLPKSAAAARILAIASLEGERFHAFTVGKILGENEDYIEDLIHDDEFELDGRVVGTCEGVVAPGQLWASLQDGLHPVFELRDPRVSSALRASLNDEDRANHAIGLMNALLEKYTPMGMWACADILWKLATIAKRRAQVQQLLLLSNDGGRIEAGFRRLLPVLMSKRPFRLALARLFGAAMEAGTMGTTIGKPALADQAFQAAAAASERMGRPGPAGEALARLGEVRLALAMPKPAAVALDLASRLLTQSNHVRSAARVSLLQAEVDVLEGNIDTAMEKLTAAVEVLRKQEDPSHVALGLIRIARLAYEKGDTKRAIALLEEGNELAIKGGDPRPIAASLMGRAFIYTEENELGAAFQLLQKAVEAFKLAQMPPHVLEVAAAGLQRRDGKDIDAAIQRLTAAAEAFKKAGAALQWAEATHELARAANDQKRYDDAVKLINESLDVRKRARDRFALIRMYDDLATAQTAQNNIAEAYSALAMGLEIAKRAGLNKHVGPFQARKESLLKALKKVKGDAEQLDKAAASDLDALEALWNAPPQVQQPEQQQVQ